MAQEVLENIRDEGAGTDGGKLASLPPLLTARAWLVGASACLRPGMGLLAMFIMEEEKGRKNVQGEVIFHRATRLGLQRLLTACGGKARSKKDTSRPKRRGVRDLNS